MKATITSKGRMTIPIAIRRKLNLKAGQILDFDESVPFLKATKVIDASGMYAVIGCCRQAMKGLSAEKWLNEIRGPVELPADGDVNAK